MSHDVLMVSLSSAYFHFERSYFLLAAEDAAVEATVERFSRGVLRSSIEELDSCASLSASSWSLLSCSIWRKEIFTIYRTRFCFAIFHTDFASIQDLH